MRASCRGAASTIRTRRGFRRSCCSRRGWRRCMERYVEFLQRFPTLQALAAAEERDVLDAVERAGLLPARADAASGGAVCGAGAGWGAAVDGGRAAARCPGWATIRRRRLRVSRSAKALRWSMAMWSGCCCGSPGSRRRRRPRRGRGCARWLRCWCRRRAKGVAGGGQGAEGESAGRS